MKNLYLIGNGFDLHHGMKSGYTHYMDYLKKEDAKLYNRIIELYPDADKWEWWSNFEDNLGYPDYQKFITDVELANEELDNDRAAYWDNQRGTTDVKDIMGGLLGDIKTSFHKWVSKKTGTPDEKRQLVLEKEDCLYINFNYTKTLEELYGINNVCHIHGVVSDALKDERFILGHACTKQKTQENIVDWLGESYEDGLPSDMQIATRTEVVNQMDVMYKNTSAIIQKNKQLFEDMADVETVFIFGLSFGPVDMDYLKEVVMSVPKSAEYIISYYSEDDLKNISSFSTTYGINPIIIKMEQAELDRILINLNNDFTKNIEQIRSLLKDIYVTEGLGYQILYSDAFSPCKRTSRMEMFILLLNESKNLKSDYKIAYRLFREAYIMTDNIHEQVTRSPYGFDLKVYIKELEQNLGNRPFLDDEETAFLKSLKFPLTVYRGMSDDEKESGDFGISWTTDKDYAEKYVYYCKNNNSKDYGWIAETQITEDDVFAIWGELGKGKELILPTIPKVLTWHKVDRKNNV